MATKSKGKAKKNCKASAKAKYSTKTKSKKDKTKAFVKKATKIAADAGFTPKQTACMLRCI